MNRTHDLRDTPIDDERNRGEGSPPPRVAALSHLGDFEVADGVPDPRGWDVVAADGEKVGKVHDLVVDTAAMRTRYLDVTLDKDIAEEGDRDILIPIGAARLDENDDRAVLNSMTLAQIAALPAFAHGKITREYEDALLAAIRGGATVASSSAPATASDASDFYANSHFDDAGFFGSRNQRQTGSAPANDVASNRGNDETRLTRSEEELDISKRTVQSGEVEIHKHVETEHVSRPVTVTREVVTVQRRTIPADRAAAGATDIQDTGDEIRIPIVEEEVVVETRPVVKEELVIRKHAVKSDETVEADLRKERIDVDRSDTRDQRP